MAPLIKEFKNRSEVFQTKICVTAQHREMLDQVLNFFAISPDYDLDLMRPGQNLYSLTSTIISSLKDILEDFTPDFVFVHGDTTTTMAGSIAGFYSGAKVCHVEAGLRTFNKLSPFPEEINRQITSRICDFHFAPTKNSKKNLIAENVSKNDIIVTGNTVIDALFHSVKQVNDNPSEFIQGLEKRINGKDVVLVTGHRRENHGDAFERICFALQEISNRQDDTLIVYPVHLNPNVQEPVRKILSGNENILLIDPLSYPDFIWLMDHSKIIITDSGGVQEEAPSLGKPVLVMRDTTERPEAVDAGTVVLVGTDQDLIVSEALDLLNDEKRYAEMSKLHNPYGDGEACKRIVNFISSK